jgi:hypothetical protein
MARVGRYPRGEAHPGARLTNDLVRELRALRGAGMTWRELAAHADVADATVRKVIAGQTWGHVE